MPVPPLSAILRGVEREEVRSSRALLLLLLGRLDQWAICRAVTLLSADEALPPIGAGVAGGPLLQPFTTADSSPIFESFRDEAFWRSWVSSISSFIWATIAAVISSICLVAADEAALALMPLRPV